MMRLERLRSGPPGPAASATSGVERIWGHRKSSRSRQCRLIQPGYLFAGEGVNANCESNGFEIMKLTIIDWTIMVVYFVFVLGIGFALKRYMKTSKDFYAFTRKQIAGLNEPA